MSPSGIQVNKTFFIVLVGVFAGVVVVYRFFHGGQQSNKTTEHSMTTSCSAAWCKDEFVDIPKELVSGGQDLEKEVTEEVELDGKKLKIFTRQAEPKDGKSDLDVLFLHGMKFSSQNWHDIFTLGFVAKWGYRAVAIDLPGYGKSKDQVIGTNSNGPFIAAVVKGLHLNQPVIVSPSMSGGFSLPYLFDDPKTSKERSRGYVPVAPVRTGDYVKQYKDSQIPTMIVYGERDDSLGTESLKNLKNLPNSEPFKIPKAGHAAYLDDPKYFHKLLYNFLKAVAAQK